MFGRTTKKFVFSLVCLFIIVKCVFVCLFGEFSFAFKFPISGIKARFSDLWWLEFSDGGTHGCSTNSNIAIKKNRRNGKKRKYKKKKSDDAIVTWWMVI